jgi:predicted PurR-regulated permease PerM
MPETKAVILSVAFFFVLLFLILFLWQMWRTAKNMATALETLNKTLPETLANLEEITANINSTTDMIKHEAEEFTLLSQQVRAFLGRVSDMEEILLQGIRFPLVETLKTALGLLKGVQVFYKVLTLPDGARQSKER